MSDAINDSRLVEWIRELFQNATAESMIRWMLVAWVVAVAALVALDRLSSALLGRSRPLTQAPPHLARTWRWRRGAIPPSNYTMLPSGTLLTPVPNTSVEYESIPLVFDPDDEFEDFSEPILLLDRPNVPDDIYWEDLVSVTHPLFGYENNARLELGRPPERFNPVLGRVERIRRSNGSGPVTWPSDTSSDRLTISFADSESEPHGTPDSRTE